MRSDGSSLVPRVRRRGFDLGEALSFGRDGLTGDRRAVVWALLMLIPLVGPLTFLGLLTEVQRRLHEGHPTPVPGFSWRVWGALLQRSLAPAVALLITGAALVPPLVLAYLVSVVLAIAAVAGASPVLLLLCALGAYAVVGAAGAAALTAGAALQLRAEVTGSLREALALRPVVDLVWGHGRRLLLPTLALCVVGTVMTALGSLFLVVGAPLALAFVTLSAAHLRHQLHMRHLDTGGEPTPVAGLLPERGDG